MTSKNKDFRGPVTASAPGKLMLSVGYAVVHGYPTIVTAVDQRLYATVKKNGVDIFHLEAPDLGLSSYTKTINDLGKRELPKAVRFIEMLYKRFLEKYPQDEGIVVTTKSDFASHYGFGSSSAVTVAFAKALTTLYGIKISKKELFKMCYQAVLDVQGVGSGYDIASAIWGGTLLYVKPAKVIQEVPVESLPIVVVYSGVKADTPTLVRLVNSMLDREPEDIKRVFGDIGNIAEGLVQAIEDKDWQKVGYLFNRSQANAAKLGVSSSVLENLISVAMNNGAYGATSSGAAGGDCVLATYDPSDPESKQKILDSWKRTGSEIVEVGLNAEGVRLE
jgi:mevalonate kinase